MYVLTVMKLRPPHESTHSDFGVRQPQPFQPSSALHNFPDRAISYLRDPVKVQNLQLLSTKRLKSSVGQLSATRHRQHLDPGVAGEAGSEVVVIQRFAPRDLQKPQPAAFTDCRKMVPFEDYVLQGFP